MEKEDPEGQKKSGLVVDDDPTMRKAIVDILIKDLAFHEVFEAGDGLAAYRLLKKNKCDIVFLDWMMPVMDGYNFLKTIRQSPSLWHTLVIMITSKRAIKAVNDAIEVGVSDYIIKPFDKDILVGKIKKIMQNKKISKQELEYLEKALHHHSEKDYTKALENYTLAEKIVPGRTETKIKIAELSLDSGDIEAADEKLIKIERGQLSKPLAKAVGSLTVRVGDHHYKNERLVQAEEKYNDAISVNPNQGDAFVALGNIEVKRGNEEGAKNLFEKALHLDVDEDDIDMFNDMAIRHRRAGRSGDAIKTLERAIDHIGDNPILYYNLGRAFMDAHYTAEAINSFQKALEMDNTLIEADRMIQKLTKRFQSNK